MEKSLLRKPKKSTFNMNFIRLISIAALLTQMSCSLTSMLSQRPTIDYQSIELADFTMEYIDLKLKLKLNNPYPIKLPAGAIGGDLSLDNTTLTGLTAATPDVPANGSAPFPITVRLPFKSILSMGSAAEAKEMFNLRFKGNADVKVGPTIPGMPDRMSLPFDYTQEVPAIIPEVTFENVQFEAPSLASPIPSLAFDLGLKNKAQGKFNIGNMDYQVMMGAVPVLSGKTEKLTNTGTAAVARVKSSLSLSSVPFALLQSTKNLRIKGGTSVSFPGFAKDQSFPLNFDKGMKP
ncbi:MAG: LEA type 2 family protein [Spirochaetia bacterium]|nr:LEA type 2 family protein [Spirochaetia bacterium]